MESEAGKNGELVSSVEALYVCRGVCLGITKPLRLFKHFLVRGVLVGHLCENIVGGAVYYAHHRKHFVALQIIQKGADYGNAAHAACFVKESAVVLFCGLFKLVVKLAEQLFVGSYDRFAGIEGRQYERFCRFYSAHYFHHYVHIGVGAYFGDVGSNFAFLHAERKRLLLVEFEDVFNNDVYALRFLVEFPVFGQHFVSAAAYYP